MIGYKYSNKIYKIIVLFVIDIYLNFRLKIYVNSDGKK